MLDFNSFDRWTTRYRVVATQNVGYAMDWIAPQPANRNSTRDLQTLAEGAVTRRTLVPAPPSSVARPLSIAMMTTQKLWHGGEEQAALLAEGLRERGHRCQVLARHDSRFATKLSQRGFEVVTFAGRGRLPHAVYKVRRQLRQWEPDLVYLNDPHALTAFGLASLGTKRPPSVAARRVDFALKHPFRYQHFADRLICVSHAVRDMCIAAGIEPHRVDVIHDGVDPARMVQGSRERGRTSLRLLPHQQLVLTVAKLTDHKGHRYLLQAMPKLIKQHPNLVWAIAGDGALADEIQHQAIRLGVADHVWMLGHRKDVADLMAAADLLAVPSHMEGLCSSIIDAMFMGLPVVATTAGGIPDLLASSPGEPEVGWLVPPRSSEALGQMITKALKFPNATREMAERARVRAEQRFSANDMVEQTIEVFYDALRAKR